MDGFLNAVGQTLRLRRHDPVAKRILIIGSGFSNAGASAAIGINRNRYQAEIKTRAGGRVTVKFECENSSHARQLLEMKYGSGVVNTAVSGRIEPFAAPLFDGHCLPRVLS
jgi:hypothetical protein